MGTLSGFSANVAAVISNIYGEVEMFDVPREARAELEFVRDDARLIEAATVEPIVAAFARAELYPRGEKGLGVYGLNLVNALGHQLGEKRLRKLTRAQADAALSGVRGALAFGYVAFLALEPDSPFSVQERPDLRRIWRITVSGFRAEGVRVLGVPDNVVDNMEAFGERALLAQLRRGEVIGRRARRVGFLGRYYAHAGAMIRAAQTDVEFPMKTEFMANGLPDLWPYDEFVGPRR